MGVAVGVARLSPAPFQVHFFNSFFYDKLRTRGYEGVQRWTKNVRGGASGGGVATCGWGLKGRGLLWVCPRVCVARCVQGEMWAWLSVPVLCQ